MKFAVKSELNKLQFIILFIISFCLFSFRSVESDSKIVELSTL